MIILAFNRIFCNNNNEISTFLWRRLTDAVQCRAERVSFRMRREVLSADNWLDHHLGFAANDI
jgi:hypothetical protein